MDTPGPLTCRRIYVFHESNRTPLRNFQAAGVMDLSTMIGDMMQVGESLQEQLEFSIRGFQQGSREAA